MTSTPEVDLSEFNIKRGCVIANLDLSPDQRTKLDAALAYPKERIPNVEILRVLKEWGFTQVRKTSLADHRLGDCCCD